MCHGSSIAPLGFVMLQGLLSQRRELDADARAAQITAIRRERCRFGQVAQLSRMPVEGRGIMDSIIEPPSMENGFSPSPPPARIPDARALAILRNPDEAYDDSIRNLAFNRPVLACEPV